MSRQHDKAPPVVRAFLQDPDTVAEDVSLCRIGRRVAEAVVPKHPLCAAQPSLTSDNLKPSNSKPGLLKFSTLFAFQVRFETSGFQGLRFRLEGLG